VFKLSSDPLSIDNIQDIVGLYMSPPNGAVVLCINETSQIQALDREQPALPTVPDQRIKGDGYSRSPMACPVFLRR
jgi:hypothetical protein